MNTRPPQVTIGPQTFGSPMVIYHATGKRLRSLPITIDKILD